MCERDVECILRGRGMFLDILGMRSAFMSDCESCEFFCSLTQATDDARSALKSIPVDSIRKTNTGSLV